MAESASELAPSVAVAEIPSDTVFEDDNFKVILDLSPASKGHMLILPKTHARDIKAR